MVRGGAPRGVCLPVPPPFPWGRGPVAALRCCPGGYSPGFPRFFLCLRAMVVCCVLRVWAPRGGCCFRAFCCRASVVCGLWCRSSRLRSALVCRQAPCRFVLRFTAFRPRTPCFCNPLMVSQEQPDYVLSSVLKTDVSTAISAKSQGVRAFLDSHALTVHFRSLAGTE